MKPINSIHISGLVLLGMLLWIAESSGTCARYEGGLEEALDSAPKDRMIPLVVAFHDPLDPSVLRDEIAGMSLPERREHVIERLRHHLEETAGDAINWIENEAEKNRSEHLQPLWIAHSYVCRIRADRIPIFAEHPQVKMLIYDPPLRIEDCVDAVHGEEEAHDDDPVPLLRWGLEYIGTPTLWERGYYGRGIIVAVIDTGVDLLHPDLALQIWINEDEIPGNNIDDDQNGCVDDINGWNFYCEDGEVDDGHGHGTKCAGIVCGNGAGGDTTGVAPQATLMVLKNWEDEWSSESTHPLAVQYAVLNGANMISCSMSYDHNGPYAFNEIHRNTQVSSLLAGLIHANSQGNNGDTYGPPYNVNPPALCPPPWLHPDQTLTGGVSAMVACGRFSITGALYATSTRGPVEWYGDHNPVHYHDYPYQNGALMGLMKPDIVGPGTTFSTQIGGGYSFFNGESCAVPHIAGALGLLRSIHQQTTPEQLCEAIKMSAEDGGEPGHDNDFGAGRLRVDLAHEYLDGMFEYGGIAVQVINIDGIPVEDARVELNENEVRAWSDQEGIAFMERVIPGIYVVQAYSENYGSGMIDEVEITAEQVILAQVILTGETYFILPIEVNATLAPDDTLDVIFTAGNPEQEDVTLEISLQPAGGLDWESDIQVVLAGMIGTIEPGGVAINDTTIVLTGTREGPVTMPMIWRFELDGTLIDSMCQPDRFTDGIGDLATGNDGFFYCGYDEYIFTINSEWEVTDSILTPLNDIDGIAYNDVGDWFYVNQGPSMYSLTPNGIQLGVIDLDGSPAALAYNHDDTLGPAVYCYEQQDDGAVTIKRIDLESGLVTTLVEFGMEDGDDPHGLDIDFQSARPFCRLATLSRSGGIEVYDREVQQAAYSFMSPVVVPPGETTVNFALHGTICTPGSSLQFELEWKEQGGDWSATVPINVEIIDYAVVEESRTNGLISAELLPPFPNPFNATVQLEYYLSETSEVSLSVFNVLGQEVAVIDQGYKEPGNYLASWEAKDMATGLYIAVLIAGQERHAVKLLLVR